MSADDTEFTTGAENQKGFKQGRATFLNGEPQRVLKFNRGGLEQQLWCGKIDEYVN